MSLILIYNPSSGSNYGLRRLRELFKESGVQIDYSFTLKQLSSRKLKQCVGNGVTVAVVGGDGTLNAVARLLVNTPSTLLPLPGGTFNHFVRDLGMYPSVEENVAALATADTKTIDVGYVNDELFLNNSNLGLYPFSLIERKSTKKLLGKYAAAVLSAFDQLVIFRRHSLKIDGETIKSPFVFVGNNVYDIKSSLIPERVSFDKGVLTVMIATSGSRRALIRAIFAVLGGDVSHRDDFQMMRRADLTIHSRHWRVPVSLDGEVKKLTPPLEYRCAPAALRVLVVSRE